jgi:ribosomal protein S12 methylthiotransferase accessory factor YcaO
MAGESPGLGRVYVPVQMAGLFCNLDEIALFDSPGSTGIATGCTLEEARVAALLEILERDAEATTPFSKASCFRLEADPDRDPLIAALLADYAALGINVQFQDLTGPLGVPAFKCFVMSPKGAIARGHGAGLSARRAVISALTETPFAYPEGGPSGPMLRKLPARRLHELPDYTLPTPAANLALLEDLLRQNGRPPVYVSLTRPELGFPVTRALVPGLELAADRDAFSRIPRRLYENYLRLPQG